jgi:hypothetical protein
LFLDNIGLYQFRYSPKVKPTAGTTVERPVQERLFDDVPAPQPIKQSTVAHAKPKARSAKKRGKGSDIFIIVAIIAAVIAISVLVYGAMTNNLPFLD